MKKTRRKREPAAGSASRQAVVEAQPAKSPAANEQTGLVIRLAGNRGLKDAAELKQALCVQSAASEVTLDVRELERVDTATMQLLCAFVRDRSARDRSVVWLGDSPPLQDAARLLGVTDLLALSQPGESGVQRSEVVA